MAQRRSRAGDHLTEIILKTFRLNGRFLAIAEEITAGSGLTAARWQVLGAVLREPLPVSGIARSMGLTRQSVQRLADALVEDGLCAYEENPEHKRAKLLMPTKKGWAAIDKIAPTQIEWASRLGAIVGERALEATNRTLDALLEALDTSGGRLRAGSAHHTRK